VFVFSGLLRFLTRRRVSSVPENFVDDGAIEDNRGCLPRCRGGGAGMAKTMCHALERRYSHDASLRLARLIGLNLSSALSGNLLLLKVAALEAMHHPTAFSETQ